jgi:hypothetical protein
VTGSELAALAAALDILDGVPAGETAPETGEDSRWKLAARRPELELEDVRAL